jgi:hypothetical protein
MRFAVKKFHNCFGRIWSGVGRSMLFDMQHFFGIPRRYPKFPLEILAAALRAKNANAFFGLIVSFLIIFSTSGCAFLSNPQGVMALKRYSDNQAQIQIYVDKQVKLFDKLVSDLKDQKLEVGASQKEFMHLYGEPVLLRKADDPKGGEVLLYRHPTEYFNTDRVYAYFDDTGSLIRWEYKPYQP